MDTGGSVVDIVEDGYNLGIDVNGEGGAYESGGGDDDGEGRDKSSNPWVGRSLSTVSPMGRFPLCTADSEVGSTCYCISILEVALVKLNNRVTDYSFYCADNFNDVPVYTSSSYNDYFFDYMDTLYAAKFTSTKHVVMPLDPLPTAEFTSAKQVMGLLSIVSHPEFFNSDLSHDSSSPSDQDSVY